MLYRKEECRILVLIHVTINVSDVLNFYCCIMFKCLLFTCIYTSEDKSIQSNAKIKDVELD